MQRAVRPPEADPEVVAPSAAGPRLVFLIAGGLAIAVAFLDSRLWPLAWVGLGPLFRFAPEAPSVRRAALDGWVMGMATNVPAFAWLIETIHRFGHFPTPIAWFFYAALSAWGACQFAVVAGLLRFAGRRAPLLLAPAVWTAVEFLYPNLFPWRLGHSQRDVLWLIQIGDLTGPYALSFAIAWSANAAFRRPFRLARLLAPSVAVALLLGYGAWRTSSVDAAVAVAPRYRVGIVQGNLQLDEKRHADHYESNVARYRRLSLDLVPTPDLFVWPETVVEWGLPHDGPLPFALDPFPEAPAPLLFGAVSYRRTAGEPQWFNSAFLRTTDGQLSGRYDKIVLMPFGEFIPFASWFPSLKQLSPETGDFVAGAGPVVVEASPAARIAPSICYEDLLAGHVRDTVNAGATLLVTVANDAWFGTSAALKQHETLALWRAIENRRFFVRSTNTGLTSVIDPVGRTVVDLPVETATATIADVRLLALATPYQRVGDAFGFLVLVSAALLLVYAKRS